MSLVQQWLRDKASHYQHAQSIILHISTALDTFPALRPKSDVYTFDDGRSQLLLCLHGLLPISFRNTAYNIPIAVWLPRDYPNEPPIPYVVPTSDMLVKAGKHLDLSGRCIPDYVQQWSRKSEGCTLVTLLQEMQQLFSREPPVYTKPKPSEAPPALPPRPAPAAQPSPQPPHYIQSPPAHLSPPPRPPPLPNVVQPPPPPPPPPITLATPASAPPPQPPPPLVPYIPSPPRPLPNFLEEEDSVRVLPVPTQSAPPPRPPNPELLNLHAQIHLKLTSELASLTQALSLDAERLRAQQADLLSGQPAIRDEMARLEAVRDVCNNVATRLGDSVSKAEANIAELKRKGDPEVDELVCSTTIVHNQLINLVAEDNAIEDTIYQLHRALNSGRINLERFLRAARVLAEEQFLKRALIEKIQSSLDPHWTA